MVLCVCDCAGFSVEGPSKAQIECHDNKDGSADVTYLPTVAGQYAVHVMCNNEDINGSPFIVNVQPPPHTLFDPSQVSLTVCLSVCDVQPPPHTLFDPSQVCLTVCLSVCLSVCLYASTSHTV